MWVSVLALLSLQASFQLPPRGTAVMMARTIAPVQPRRLRRSGTIIETFR